MEQLVENVTKLLSSLTVLANIASVVLLFALLLTNIKAKVFSNYLKKIRAIASKFALPVSFFIALISMSGSLFFSEVAKYEPCVLCWYQRILMYPLVLLFVTALIKKETKYIINYALPLVVTGLVIALFHSLQQGTYNPFMPCSAIGYSVSCSKFFFRTFGYITIPVMSASAFGLIFALMLSKKMSKD